MRRGQARILTPATFVAKTLYPPVRAVCRRMKIARQVTACEEGFSGDSPIALFLVLEESHLFGVYKVGSLGDFEHEHST